MGWEKGKYYTRSRKVRGRVIRQYIGSGEFAQSIAEVDSMLRVRRHFERKCWLDEKAELSGFDARIARIENSAEAIAQAALLVAGFHEHRGQWRKRRGRREQS